jgi:hypothetical protein
MDRIDSIRRPARAKPIVNLTLTAQSAAPKIAPAWTLQGLSCTTQPGNARG